MQLHVTRWMYNQLLGAVTTQHGEIIFIPRKVAEAVIEDYQVAIHDPEFFLLPDNYLTPSEERVWQALYKRKDTVTDYKTLLDESCTTTMPNLRVHVHNLIAKLDCTRATIITIAGRGYKLEFRAKK